uniref:Uncharacterized protein n=1 Tax=Lepeophtheirus salmonis TaxID=72036 RepID=A0A0K2V2J4_LEPSM
MITFLIEEDVYYLINDAISISSLLLARFCILTKIITLTHEQVDLISFNERVVHYTGVSSYQGL